jgi:caffeoyl-CoA O-methyltransferase
MRSPENSSLEKYVADLYAPEDAGLLDIRRRLQEGGRDGVQIGPVEGKILQILIRMNSVKKAVEIGTLYGYSAVWIARALPDDGHLFTFEKDPVAIAQARLSFANCELSQKVTLVEGDAAVTLPKLQGPPFDMIFIDARKSAYFEVLDWAKANIRKGGLIVADNTFLRGAVAGSERPERVSASQLTEMRKFNEALADPEHFCSVILPTTEGLSVAIKL